MKVSELVDCTSLVSATPECSLGDICDIMKEEQISGVPVIGDDGALKGLISIGQILHFAHDGAYGPQLVDPEWHSPVQVQPAKGVWRNMLVKDAMVKKVITVKASDDIRSAAQHLFGEGVHRAVVVGNEGQPVGMLTTMDITRYVAHSDPD